MKPRNLVAAAMLVLSISPAWAEGGGSITYKGKTYPLAGAYAYSHPDPFDKSKTATEIDFSSKSIDAKAINAAGDRREALNKITDAYFPDKEERPTKVELQISRGATGEVQQLGFSVPGTSLSGSGKKVKVELKRNDAQRIEGTLKSLNVADKNSEFGGYFELNFALDVAADPDA
jgi:hypothetical protein